MKHKIWENFSKKPSPMFADPIAGRIDAALVSYVYHQGKIGIFTAILVAAILTIGLYVTGQDLVVTIWFSVLLLISILRYALISVFQHTKDISKNIMLWKFLFAIGATLAGLCWGFAGSFLLQYEASDQIILTVLILAGLTAGSVPLNSGILPAAIAFLVCTILPLIVGLFLIGQDTYFLFGLAAILYLMYLIVLSVKSQKLLKKAISLQFDNDALLHNLADAKNQLEIINRKLAHSATHDSLTKLANRALFETNFREALQRASKNQQMLAMLYLDLDNFKGVNDAYGHHVGDLLLQKVVERIKVELPIFAYTARLGGDEFTVVLENAEPSDVEALAKRICETIIKPFTIQNCHILISISVGVSVYPFDGKDLEMKQFSSVYIRSV